jgi:hypothetical protein
LETTERHFGKYDLLQVFKIVEPDRDIHGEILPTLKAGSKYRSLFQWYAVLKVEDITASNQWYRTYPTAPWFNENMGITYEYLKTHMASDLWMKVNEEYNSYPAEAKGGPLVLYLMIHQLIAANDSIAITLSNKIDSVKISDYKGEDVGEAVTHLRAIIHRLKNMRRRDVAGNEIDLVPLDLTKRLYKIFQTSSSSEFNGLFLNQYNQEYTKYLITGNSAWADPDSVLTLAQNLYVRLCAENNWHGVDQNKATFPVITSPKAAATFLSKAKCHNCGGQHLLRDCTEPQDPARISANQKRFKSIRKLAKKNENSKSSTGHPAGGKFPPKPEKGQTNRCTVDGKQYYYHFKSVCWLPVDRQTNIAANPADNSVPTTHTKPKQAAVAEKNLILSNLNNQFKDAMAALSTRDE